MVQGLKLAIKRFKFVNYFNFRRNIVAANFIVIIKTTMIYFILMIYFGYTYPLVGV